MICSGADGVGDLGVAAQVAEPQNRVDPVGDAAGDAALEHAPAGVAAEIGLDQGLGRGQARRISSPAPGSGSRPFSAARSLSLKPSGLSVVQPE